MKVSRLLPAVAVVLGVSGQARAFTCALTTQPDGAGVRVENRRYGDDDLLPEAIAKRQGSLVLAPNYAIAVYPDAQLAGRGVLLSRERFEHKFHHTDEGDVLNLKDLEYDLYERNSAFAKDGQIRGFYCFRVGTKAANGITVYNGEEFLYRFDGYSSTYSATLSDTTGAPVLDLTVTPFAGHGGEIRHFSYDLSSGALSAQRRPLGSGAAGPLKTYRPGDGLQFLGALALLHESLLPMVTDSSPDGHPLIELREVADQVRNLLAGAKLD